TNYGQEIREKYGDDTVEKANKKWQNMAKEKFEEMQSLEKQLLADLTAYLQSDSDQKLALKLFEEHKKWLTFSWPSYSSEAHRGLGLLYISDERFTAYYDERCGNGAAQALNTIIQTYAVE